LFDNDVFFALYRVLGFYYYFFYSSFIWLFGELLLLMRF